MISISKIIDLRCCFRIICFEKQLVESIDFCMSSKAEKGKDFVIAVTEKIQ